MQADLDEAEQQLQEKSDFLKEIQQGLENMAVRFTVDIDVRLSIGCARNVLFIDL